MSGGTHEALAAMIDEFRRALQSSVENSELTASDVRHLLIDLHAAHEEAKASLAELTTGDAC